MLSLSSDPKAPNEDNPEIGLKLLALYAEAAGPPESSWIKRRVDQLEFLDIRAVRWRASVDFTVPTRAPKVHNGDRPLRLVPITALPKENLVAFDLRDGHGDALSLLTSEETASFMAPALTKMASIILRKALHPMELPTELAERLERIVKKSPAQHADAYLPFAYMTHGMNIRERRSKLSHDPRITDREFSAMRREYRSMTARSQCAVNILIRHKVFLNLLLQLRYNFLVCVGVADDTDTRMIVKLAYERTITAWTDNSITRACQSLGWRCWPFNVLIGGTGGSHHLEVAAAPGVDVVEITAKLVDPAPNQGTALWVPGFSPHVHIRVPAAPPSSRFRATVRIQTSRLGWANASAAAVSGIAIVMFTGRLKLHTLAGSADEAGTAAVLLLAVLGGIATWLVRPDEHPLASRLLRFTRILIAIDVADVLTGAGDLVVHGPGDPHTALWSVLAAVAITIATLVVVPWVRSWLLSWRSVRRLRG